MGQYFCTKVNHVIHLFFFCIFMFAIRCSEKCVQEFKYNFSSLYRLLLRRFMSRLSNRLFFFCVINVLFCNMYLICNKFIVAFF